MHSFPWWGELLINTLILLTMWQTWLVLGLAGLGAFLWHKKHKNSLDS